MDSTPRHATHAVTVLQHDVIQNKMTPWVQLTGVGTGNVSPWLVATGWLHNDHGEAISCYDWLVGRLGWVQNKRRREVVEFHFFFSSGKYDVDFTFPFIPASLSLSTSLADKPNEGRLLLSKRKSQQINKYNWKYGDKNGTFKNN